MKACVLSERNLTVIKASTVQILVRISHIHIPDTGILCKENEELFSFLFV